MPRDTFTPQQEPKTDNYGDPVDVTDYYHDWIDPTYEGKVMAYFDLWGTCSVDPSPSLVSIALIDHEMTDYVAPAALDTDFVLSIEEVQLEAVQ